MTKEIFEIKHQDKIITIITMFFPEAKIYLFGSYASGDYRRSSDIDIAIDAGRRLRLAEKGQIRNMIDALNLIQEVDIVDFYSLPEDMKKDILREGVAWKI